MKKSLHKTLTITLLLITNFAYAQNLQDAIKKTMNERYESASADFKKLRSTMPTSGDVFFYSGDNYLYWDQLDSAQTMFTQGGQINPNNPLNYVGLGRVLIKNNDWTKATEYFNKAVSLMAVKNSSVEKPTQVIAYLKMAEACIQADTKKLDEANTYIQTALKINPSNPEVYIQWGDMNLMKSSSNLTDAINQYEDAYEKDPTYTRALLRQGQLWVRVDRYDDGLNWFNQAIDQDPNFAPAYREKGELYFLAGKPKQAVEAYEKYLQLNDDPSARSRYAKFLFLNKQYDLAITEINTVMKTDSSDRIMYRLLGYALYETGKFPEGLQRMQKFFSLAATSSDVTILASDYAYEGKLFAKNAQDSLAIIDLKKALELDEKYESAYSDLAGIYYKQKKYPDAIGWYSEKLNRFADKPLKDKAADISSMGQAYYRIAESLREISQTDTAKFRERMDNYRSADSQFEKIVEVYPIFAYIWRGKCHANLDNQENPLGLAKPFYEMAINNATKDPAKAQANIDANKKDIISAYSYLGYIHYYQKNFDCSKAAWIKVQELDPTNEKAQKALADSDIISAPGTCQLIVQ